MGVALAPKTYLQRWQGEFGPWSSLPAPNLDSKWHSITIDNTNQDSCHQENVIYSAYLKIAEK